MIQASFRICPTPLNDVDTHHIWLLIAQRRDQVHVTLTFRAMVLAKRGLNGLWISCGNPGWNRKSGRGMLTHTPIAWSYKELSPINHASPTPAQRAKRATSHTDGRRRQPNAAPRAPNVLRSTTHRQYRYVHGHCVPSTHAHERMTYGYQLREQWTVKPGLSDSISLTTSLETCWPFDK